MAILTDKQMLWAVGGTALLLYVLGHEAKKKIGNAIDAIAELPGKVADAAIAQSDSMMTQYQKIFFDKVFLETGIRPADVIEEGILCRYLPPKSAQEIGAWLAEHEKLGWLSGGLNVQHMAFMKVASNLAGRAVIDYRQNKGKAYNKPWYDIF